MKPARLAVCLLGLLSLHPFLAAQQQPWRSSLQPGERIASEFHALNITGKHAGKKHCLLCENGLAPVAMIFARDVSEPLVRLLLQLDAAAADNAPSDLRSFVVFLSADAGLPDRLRELAKKHGLRHVVLSTFDPAGPEGFEVAREADVTVLLYREFIVAANHAFKKGELTDPASARIVADLPRILTKK